MPGLNSTGPEGQGPRTGRQMGNCKPKPGSDETKTKFSPGDEDAETLNGNFARRGFGRGRGYGRMHGSGRGRGFGRGRGLGRGQAPE